jgi:hypothetical protein
METGKKEQGEVRWNSVRVLSLYRGPGERRGGVAGAVNVGVKGFNVIEDGLTWWEVKECD